MNNKNSTELLERLRTDIHAVAELICDMIAMNMDWNLGLLTIKAGQGLKNSNDIARQMIEKGTCSFRELQYALSTGKLSKIKPYGIRLSTGRKVLGNSWTDLAVSMLRECASIPECKEKMLKESETGSLGRSPYLASDPSIMYRPKKIMDGLYFNAAVDAVSMFDRLVKTMDKVGFDYSSIDIMFRPTTSRYKVLPAEYADTVPFEWAYRFANGRKPTILKLPDGREIHVKSWKKVIETILEDCCKDPEHLNKLRDMAGQLSTRRGTIILSKDQEQIKTPIKLPDGLFAEGSGASDKRLMQAYRILNAAGYDYADISVQIEENNNVQAPSEQQTTEENVEQEEDMGPTLLM